MALLVNIRPVDMSNLTVLMPITFSVQNAPAAAFVAVWVRYEGSDDEILVHDGAEFIYPFDLNSTIERPAGGDDPINFSIVPELGWQRDIAKLRVQGDPTIV